MDLDLSTCRVGDEGVVHLVSAIANNQACSLRTLRLRDNHISGLSGELILDALYRNITLTTVDFRGNQLDHVRLNKFRALCQRNLQEQKEAEPRRLRREIQRLRGEQVKLRKAETLLVNYQKTIADTQARIEAIEAERAEFLRKQQSKREDLRAQVQKELDAMAETEKKLAEKRQDLTTAERQTGDRLAGLRQKLDHEVEERKNIEQALAAARRELEETVRQRPSRTEDLQRQIADAKREKALFQAQVTHIKQELARLKTAYEEGKSIGYLIEQAKALLVHNAALEEASREAVPGAAGAVAAAARGEED